MINAKAAEFPNYGHLTPEMRSEVKHAAQAVGLNEASKNPKFLDELAEGMGYNVWALKKIAEAGIKEIPGTKVAMPVVNHSGFNESFLVKALKTQSADGKVAMFGSIDEIGGFFKPGESFRITTTHQPDGSVKETCQFTDQERQKLFDGKKLSLDWGVVEDLFHKYDERLAKREGREPYFAR